MVKRQLEEGQLVCTGLATPAETLLLQLVDTPQLAALVLAERAEEARLRAAPHREVEALAHLQTTLLEHLPQQRGQVPQQSPQHQYSNALARVDWRVQLPRPMVHKTALAVVRPQKVQGQRQVETEVLLQAVEQQLITLPTRKAKTEALALEVALRLALAQRTTAALVVRALWLFSGKEKSCPSTKSFPPAITSLQTPSS